MPQNWFEIVGFSGWGVFREVWRDEQSLCNSHDPAGKGIPCWEVILTWQPLLTPELPCSVFMT